MALDINQRRKRSQIMKKFASKIKLARERASKKTATNSMILKRARNAALKIVRKIVAGKLGVDYDNLPISQKMVVDKKVEKKSKLIPKIAKRLIQNIRKKEMDKKKNLQKEGAGAGLEGTKELVDKYLEDTPHQKIVRDKKWMM